MKTMDTAQEKLLKLFTEEDWLEIKDHLKELLKENLGEALEHEYVFIPETLSDVVYDHLNDKLEKVVRDLLKEKEIDIEKILRDIVKEELRK